MNERALTPQEAKVLPLSQVRDVKTLLMNEGAQRQLQAVAAKHLNPEKLMRVLASAIRSTPGLQKCDPMTFLGALMQCASLGLEPNTPMGHAYLIPFNRRRKGNDGKWYSVPEVQLIIGYKGFKALAKRSGEVANMHADVVYDDDVKFGHAYGSNQHLEHVPGPRLGKKLGAYFYVKLIEGKGEGHVYMTAAEILRIRDRSQGWQQAVADGKTDKSPWTTDEDAMWAKTPVRRLAQNGDLPMTPEVIEAQRVDEARLDYRHYALTSPQDFREAAPMPFDDDEVVEEDPEPAQAVQEPEKPKPAATRAPVTRKPASPERPRQPEPAREPTMNLGDQGEGTGADFADPPPAKSVNRQPAEASDPRNSAIYRMTKEDVETMGEEAAYAIRQLDIDAIRYTMPLLYYVLWQLMPDEVPITSQERDAGEEATQGEG